MQGNSFGTDQLGVYGDTQFPGANASPINVQVPPGFIYQVTGIQCRIITDSTVQNRVLRLQVDDNALIQYDMTCDYLQGADEDNFYYWGRDAEERVVEIDPNPKFVQMRMPDLWLRAGHDMVFSIFNNAAGDVIQDAVVSYKIHRAVF